MAGSGRVSADDRLAAELAAGKVVANAATAAGVSERTAFRRLADPTFKGRVAELRSGMVAAAAGRLTDGMTEAAGVLRELLTHPNSGVRLRAAVKVIEFGMKVGELESLARQVGELRESLAATGSDAGKSVSG